MAKYQQRKTVSQPRTPDLPTLREYSGVVQENLFDLWSLAHDHVGTPTQKAQYAALTTDAQRIAYIAGLLGLL